ncbi:hypothetical protein KAR91_73400, partial [Candidatus Pacearchaeota archaeon]|nr:hypothetical protein [Candidatus Pacearchaeota archaeon]
MNKGENFVYLAGPIRNKWRILRWLNIWRGRCAAKKLNNAGFYVFCPHMNFATMGIGGKAEDHMVKQD